MTDRKWVRRLFSALRVFPWLVIFAVYIEVCLARLTLSRWPTPITDDPKHIAVAPLHLLVVLLFLSLGVAIPLVTEKPTPVPCSQSEMNSERLGTRLSFRGDRSNGIDDLLPVWHELFFQFVGKMPGAGSPFSLCYCTFPLILFLDRKACWKQKRREKSPAVTLRGRLLSIALNSVKLRERRDALPATRAREPFLVFPENAQGHEVLQER